MIQLIKLYNNENEQGICPLLSFHLIRQWYRIWIGWEIKCGKSNQQLERQLHVQSTLHLLRPKYKNIHASSLRLDKITLGRYGQLMHYKSFHIIFYFLYNTHLLVLGSTGNKKR